MPTHLSSLGLCIAWAAETSPRGADKNLENPWIAQKSLVRQIFRPRNHFLINDATTHRPKPFQIFPNFSFGVLGDFNNLEGKKFGTLFLVTFLRTLVVQLSRRVPSRQWCEL
jgi:hypothetical protein